MKQKIETNFIPTDLEQSKSSDIGFNDSLLPKFESVSWQDIVGFQKPEDNATEGATTGDNLKDENKEVLNDYDIKNVETYECGEDIGDKDVVCIKAVPDDEFITIADDATVWDFNPNTNYGSDTHLKIGVWDGKTANFFIKIPTAGAPLTYRILKVELLLYMDSYVTSAGNTFTIRNPNAAWDASTITWNNQPATTDLLNTQFTANEKSITSADNATYISIDITQIFKRWQNGDLANRGLFIGGGLTAAERCEFNSSNAATNKPLLRITELSSSDGKLYKASADDYNLCRTLLGFSKEAGSTGDNIKVQKFGKIDLGGTTYGRRLYLTADGSWTSGNSTRNRMIFLGKQTGGESETEIKMQENDVFIETIPYLDSGVGYAGKKFYALGDTKLAVVSVTASDGSGHVFRGEILVRKDRGNSSIKISLSSTAYLTVAWSSTNNYLAFGGSGINTCTIYSIAFYN